MSKILIVANVLNVFLLLVLIASVAGFISFGNVYGLFLAAVTAAIAWGVYKHQRWGYFAAAAWALACYQLSKQGYEFQAIKRQVMILGFSLIPVALFLHETLGKAASKSAQNNGKNNDINRKMPD
ncbi:hypothetical protein [Cellvibrio sp. PSBB023]|jgi:hypothetical protein|uniref:hypothetical protein n=1 Tax=Cellvibrio sp. PSBB023 TaxID=1945512 RepID=UPI00098FE6E0|nr:hypothetical protein [Cellvibrio sp. PSBB023]AQT60858.1 hypothetical protein B0D95_12775 [Cellvibrio sp. PSBB023]